MLMKKMLAIILVSLVLSGCEKNGSQNDLIINNTEEENVVMEKTENIYNTALEIFKFADDNNITTHQAAFSMAQKRIDDAKNELKK
jgi:uncharacterized protein YcfL